MMENIQSTRKPTPSLSTPTSRTQFNETTSSTPSRLFPVLSARLIELSGGFPTSTPSLASV
jgi:hypothetical protein